MIDAAMQAWTRETAEDATQGEKADEPGEAAPTNERTREATHRRNDSAMTHDDLEA